MTEKQYEDGHCPSCGSDRADVIVQHKDEYRDHHFQANTYYSVLECRGCGEKYFKSSSSNSEDYHHFGNPETGEHEMEYAETVAYWPPAAKRRPPEWSHEIGYSDRVMGSLFDDVYTALSNNLGVLAAIGMRTVFDRASELLGIEPNFTFKKKLDALKNSDHITGNERTALTVLVDAGSAAAHRGWRPKPKHLDQMMTILEAFLHRAFVLEDIGAELEKHVPKRPKKK